jgi:hypothetical protein
MNMNNSKPAHSRSAVCNCIFEQRLGYALQNEKMDAGSSDVRQSLPSDALITTPANST